MGHKDRESVAPRSLPPETELIDASWDDDSDLVSGIELAPLHDEVEDDGDRVTAVPDVPAELLAQQLMARAPASAPPEVATEEAASLHDRETPTEALRPRPPSLELPFAHRSAPAFELGEEATLQAAPQSPWMSPSADDLDLSPAADLELELPLEPSVEPAEEPPSPYQEMKDRYAMGDFTGALVTAESLLETDAEDEQALRYAESCRDVLTQMYAARLGPLTQTVRVGVPPDQIRWLSLDHRAGFLLSMVDGTSSIEEILDVSGMTRLDALRILFTLLEQQVIVLEPGLD